MTRSPVPGEARVEIAAGRLPVISNVVLAAQGEELTIDAILDTGSTHCVIPHQQAMRLGLTSENRLGIHRIRGIGGFVTTMDRHRLQFVQVGAARAYEVDALTGDALAQFMLLGTSLLKTLQRSWTSTRRAWCSAPGGVVSAPAPIPSWRPQSRRLLRLAIRGVTRRSSRPCTNNPLKRVIFVQLGFLHKNGMDVQACITWISTQILWQNNLQSGQGAVGEEAAARIFVALW